MGSDLHPSGARGAPSVSLISLGKQSFGVANQAHPILSAEGCDWRRLASSAGSAEFCEQYVVVRDAEDAVDAGVCLHPPTY